MLIEINDAVIKEIQDYHRDKGYEITETPLELKNIIEGCVLDEYRSLID